MGEVTGEMYIVIAEGEIAGENGARDRGGARRLRELGCVAEETEVVWMPLLPMKC